MRKKELLNTTGQISADNEILKVVEAFETTFPDRIRGYYVEGSHSDGTSVSTSDLDIIIVFKNGFLESNELEAASELARNCAKSSQIELDFDIVDELSLVEGGYPMLKLGSLLIYGEDIRSALQLLPIEVWARQRMHAAYWLIANVFQRPQPVCYPLGYPNPHDSYYGYVNRTVRLTDGSTRPTTRNLIRVTGWAATALVAQSTGQYVVRKRDCLTEYRKHIGDEWTELLESIYQQCRVKWNYLIPDREDEQEVLRSICGRTLGFENHFLKIYKTFLLAELRSANEVAYGEAIKVQGFTFLWDDDVIHAMQSLRANKDQVVSQTATSVLTKAGVH